MIESTLSGWVNAGLVIMNRIQLSYNISFIQFFLYICIVKRFYLFYCLDRLVRRAPIKIAAPPRIVRGRGMTPKRTNEPTKAATGSR